MKADILLVEDSPTQAMQIRHLLEEGGHRVSHAASGAAALAAARAAPPQIIVSDVMMPEMNGYELCSACKSDSALRRIPFILLTTLDAPGDVIHGLQAQADKYVIKPAVRLQLLNAVQELLSAPAPAPEPPGEPPVDIVFDGKPYRIPASREQIAALLLSTYEAAVQSNRELLVAKEKIQTHEAELEERVRARTAELSQANADLHEAVGRLQAYDRARSDFIDNVCHELRTPLTSLSCAMTNLLKGVAGPLPEKVRGYLLMCAEECGRLKATVADILDMERIDTQALVFHSMKVPVASWVRRVSEKLRSRAAKKNQTLTVTGQTVTGFADADPLKLDRVIVSVIGNAIHYTPEGGHIEVDIHRVRDSRWIELSVTDDGIGIPPEHVARVTERYYRVGEFVSGTGLGLALCKEILERQGGEIELQSPPPGRARGTRAMIRLPLAEKPPVVLAVDDSKTIQMLMEQQLASSGYETIACGSAEQALARMSKEKPDLLIIDTVLPGMDGIDLVSKIKADHELRHLPILMVTGAEITGRHRDTVEDFRIPILPKPWLRDELIACLEDAIYGKHYLER